MNGMVDAGVMTLGFASAKTFGSVLQGYAGANIPAAIPKPVVRFAATLAGGTAIAMLVGAVTRGKARKQQMMTGTIIAAMSDLLEPVIAMAKTQLGLPMSGYGDYVQMPYGDYVQMPYSGYGTPAQVAAGSFGDYVQMPYSGYGTPAQVAAGSFGASGEMATFGPTF
jgi:hypothetical protein